METRAIERARQLLANIEPEKRQSSASKGILLDSLRTDVLEALGKKASLRQVWGTLKKAGYAGSYQLLQQKVLEWRKEGFLPERKEETKPAATKVDLSQSVVEQDTFSNKKSAYDNPDI